MINLIRNEFAKVFKKKTIYILLFITIGYIILSNIIIKASNNDNYTYYYDDVKYFESQLAELDPKKSSDLSMYIDTKVNLEISKLINEYGTNSWQSYIINTVLPSYINTMISHEYTDEITKEAYNEAKQAYDTAIQKLKSDDWKYFANKDLKEINKSLEEPSKK